MLICNSAGWRHRPIGSPQAIVLLDEATSALDAITEAQVHRQLAALRCTRIVIAHRLHTMRDADLILVLEDGAIIERARAAPDPARTLCRPGTEPDGDRRGGRHHTRDRQWHALTRRAHGGLTQTSGMKGGA